MAKPNIMNSSICTAISNGKIILIIKITIKDAKVLKSMGEKL